MSIAVLTAGSTGDVEPFFLLAEALAQAGYPVRIAAPKNYQSRANNLDFYPIQADFQQLIQGDAGSSMIAGGRNPLKVMREGQRAMQGVAQQMTADIWTACQGATLIINHVGMSVLADTIAEKLNVPFINIALQPYLPTRAYPHPMWPGQKSFGGAYNRLTGKLVSRLAWQIFQSPVNHLRVEQLKLPRQTLGHYLEAIGRAPFLNAYSPHIVPQPADWGANVHTTGFIFSPEESWIPPQDLTDFLDAGSPPVFFGFGSMPVREPERLTNTILEALKQTGQRGILSAGWAGLRADDLPDTVKHIAYTPYTWLFPRMAGVVHHGGAGTTGLALRAGIPSMITPFVADQFYWARRITELGVSPGGIPHRQLSADKLTEAIGTMVTDENMRARATALGEKLRAEDGIGEAVRVIEQVMSEGKSISS